MKSEAWVGYEIGKAWGAHPRLRFWRNNRGKAQIKGRWVNFGIDGQGDYSGLIAPEGRRLEIETKREDGQQREAQIKFQAMIEAAGGVYVLAHSLKEFDQAMAKIGIYR